MSAAMHSKSAPETQRSTAPVPGFGRDMHWSIFSPICRSLSAILTEMISSENRARNSLRMSSSKIIGLKPPMESTDLKKEGGGVPSRKLIGDARDGRAFDNAAAGMKA